MIRKIVGAFIAVVLVLNITACGGVTSGDYATSMGAVSGQTIDGETVSGQAVSGQAVEEEMTNKGTGGFLDEVEMAIPLEEQLAVIAEKREVWDMGVENQEEDFEEYYYIVDFCYALTDLDQDGYVEILTYSMQGTGYFTSYQIYEIDESGTELKKWERLSDESVEGKNVAPDLGEYPTDVYWDQRTGTYHYTSLDHAKSSGLEGADYLVDMEIGDNVIRENIITYYSYKWKNSKDDSVEETYFDSEGNKISEEESMKLGSKYYENMENRNMFFRPIYVESEEFDKMDEEELAWSLEKSWYGFSIEKIERDTKFEESLSDDIKKQLETLGSEMGGLTEYDEDMEFYLEYAVTDLDQDGRLELTVSSMQGSGRFTYYDIYEVDQTGKKLVKWKLNHKQGDSHADISIKDQVTTYKDEKSGVIYYLFEDFVRVSGDETYHIPVTLAVTDNEVKEIYDKKGDWKGMSKGTATFGWRGGYGYDIDRMKFSYFCGELVASWKKFSVS